VPQGFWPGAKFALLTLSPRLSSARDNEPTWRTRARMAMDYGLQTTDYNYLGNDRIIKLWNNFLMRNTFCTLQWPGGFPVVGKLLPPNDDNDDEDGNACWWQSG